MKKIVLLSLVVIALVFVMLPVMALAYDGAPWASGTGAYTGAPWYSQ